MGKSKFKVGDKVRVLVGERIGKIGTVERIRLYSGEPLLYEVFCDGDDGESFMYDEKWLERVPNETIVIYRNGQEVIAYDKVSKQKAVAKCSPEDKFDFKTGAKLAFDRLMDGQEENKPEEKLLNGKFVCTTSSRSCLTKGRIYEFVNGQSFYDDGKRMPLFSLCRTIEDLKRFFGEDIFIEVVE